jgi:hydrogenase maturation protease
VTSESQDWPAATAAAEPAGRVVVLGIGNALRGDEGIGAHALRRLVETHSLTQCVEVIDGGVLGLELLPRLEGCAALLVIDAINNDAPPGTIVRLEGEAVPAVWEQKLSMHQAGLGDMLALLRMQDKAPSRLVVWGIQPETIEWGLELSPTVAASLDQLVTCVADELGAWGALAETRPNS